MKPSVCCLNKSCEKFEVKDGDRPWLVSHGSDRRRRDSKVVARFRRRLCGKAVSNQTFNPTYKQKAAHSKVKGGAAVWLDTVK